MPDRETIIANIREDIDLLTYDRQPTTDELKIINDLSAAVTILKEQDTVKPKITPWKTDDNGDVIVAKRQCGNCGWMFFTENPNFCENCGKAVKWE